MVLALISPIREFKAKRELGRSVVGVVLLKIDKGSLLFKAKKEESLENLYG